jgi:hypothetical protein
MWRGDGRLGSFEYKCMRIVKKTTNPVNGQISYSDGDCSKERAYIHKDACGPDSKFFVLREKTLLEKIFGYDLSPDETNPGPVVRKHF